MLQVIHNLRVSGLKRLLLLLAVMAFTLPVLGSEHEMSGEHGESEKFNPGTMIVDHISDSHDWHLFGHVSVALPVIVKGENGFTSFASSAFHHDNDAKYVVDANGERFVRYHNSIYFASETPDEEGRYVELNEKGEVQNSSPLDLSITKNVLAMIFSLLLMLWMFMSVAKSYTRRKGEAPKGMQSLIEPIILFVRDEIAKPSIGEKKYMKFMPFLLTVFFFIWINNLLGLIPIIPGGANVTGSITVTMTLALFTFIITTFVANKSYWRHVFAMPGVPVGVLILLTPIEILGVFLRPFVLMIRLFANITAGHIIALSFFSLIFIFAENYGTGAGYGASILSVAFVVFMTMLELLVAFLQAYVFTFLSAIYFGAAVEEHHHDHDGEHAHVEEAAII